MPDDKSTSLCETNMPDDKSTSLVNLGDLSKPADTLIKKVSCAIGGVFEPWQIKRVAKAKAEASLIKSKTEIEITDLHRRAMHRFIEEEATRQENMEEITKKSLSYLKEESDPSKMEDDWVTNFFDKSRMISDGEMQTLWSKILAGEANSPGTYSKRTVNLLSDIDKKDAELFRSLCRYVWIVGNFTPLIFDAQAKIYNVNGINFISISHLDNIGLVNFQSVGGFKRENLPEEFEVSYCGEVLKLTMPNDSSNILKVGCVMLTQAGYELARISDAPRVDGFVEYVKDKWRAHI
jgi:hypothetical protein